MGGRQHPTEWMKKKYIHTHSTPDTSFEHIQYFTELEIRNYAIKACGPRL